MGLKGGCSLVGLKDVWLARPSCDAPKRRKNGSQSYGCRLYIMDTLIVFFFYNQFNPYKEYIRNINGRKEVNNNYEIEGLNT